MKLDFGIKSFRGWLLAPVLAGIWVASESTDSFGADGSLVGKQAPEFHVQGIFNEAYSLERFKGHILVMQFGSSW
ncbi:MAG TPA: hypothetical protein VJA21_11485 [Verrucomicrobiae bacterium]